MFTPSFDYWDIIKVLFLLAQGLYIIFAFVVIRQVKVMTDTLSLGFEYIAKLLAFIHFAFAIFVFIVALNIL